MNNEIEGCTPVVPMPLNERKNIIQFHLNWMLNEEVFGKNEYDKYTRLNKKGLISKTVIVYDGVGWQYSIYQDEFETRY